MLHLLQNLSAKDIAWSIFIVLDIAFVFWVLHRKGKKPGKVVEMKTEVDVTEDFYTKEETI